MVVPEAMSYGLPVLCFDNVGPGELVKEAGIKIKYTHYKNSIDEFACGLQQLFCKESLRKELSEMAKKVLQPTILGRKKAIKSKKYTKKSAMSIKP